MDVSVLCDSRYMWCYISDFNCHICEVCTEFKEDQEADAEGGYDVKVADGQIKECVKILAELMDKLNNNDVPPWENELYLLAMRLYDEAYYEMCYGDRI